MSRDTDLDRFLERFAAFGAEPSARSYLPLFHPDATLFDSGMERPITVAEIPEHIEGILKLVPDFRMTPERWRARAGTVFVEARNAATLREQRLSWRSVYCVDLRGDRVIRGRRYYDRQPLLSRVMPGLPALAFEPGAADPPLATTAPIGDAERFVGAVEACWRRGAPGALQPLFREDGSWFGPGCPRPLAREEIGPYYRALAQRVPDLALTLERWAGDETLVFVEWRAQGSAGGRAVSFGIADRFDLVAGRILSGRTYFDTLALGPIA